ncbi:Glycosyltransferase involved in cell wall bisynthesis [Candidatus Methanophagaceae archaeon]|nr:Glycosyltransferase involved in cell wall bisynthesis [Methanophagales archaeon]
MGSNNRAIVLIWGGYPPMIGGGSARIYRVTKYLSDFLRIYLFTQKVKTTRTIENYDNLKVIRLPPSNPKTDKSKHIIYYMQMFISLLIMIMRIILLYPLLLLVCSKTKPIAIIKEATTWDFGIIEEKIKVRFLFLLFKPWVVVSKLLKIPLYVYFTNLWYHKEHIEYLSTKLRYADCIIVVDLWMKEFLKHKFDFRKPIYYIPVSIDLNDFKKNNLEFPTEIKILFVARLTPERGCDTLIKAVPYIIKEVSDIKVEIVGDGYQKRSLMKLAKELGVDNYVTFRGEVHPQEIQQVYDGAKVFINSLRVPGIGNVTIEAMASGVPVVKSMIGPMQNEPIIEGINGYSFEMDDYEDLADKIIKILRMDEERWNEMSRNDRKTAEKYNIQKISQKMLQCLVHDEGNS